MDAIYIIGAIVGAFTPSGTLQFTLTSEISGTQVEARTGSWIRYRTIN